ncbi:MAG: ABC transporter ATP-binding protein [Deltaproteobacteria bacterium]|nr:ABC transporter ATP-binding protein [Deltaproteobacteria bacterium]
MLKIEAVDAYYGDLQVLWGICLDVGESELVALIGSNGSGKSTLLRVVMGLVRVASGEVYFKERCLNELKPHEIVAEGLSMVPEGRRLFPKMTVLGNLEMGAFLPEARRGRTETLEWIYGIFPILKERSHQAAGSLSGGEQQMLAIARALMSRNRFLLLDEMSLGLAPLLVQQIFRVIAEINRQGIGVLMVEQNVPMTLRIAQRAYIIEIGRVAGHGKAKDLLGDPRVREAFLGMEKG